MRSLRLTEYLSGSSHGLVKTPAFVGTYFGFIWSGAAGSGLDLAEVRGTAGRRRRDAGATALRLRWLWSIEPPDHRTELQVRDALYR